MYIFIGNNNWDYSLTIIMIIFLSDSMKILFLMVILFIWNLSYSLVIAFLSLFFKYFNDENVYTYYYIPIFIIK